MSKDEKKKKLLYCRECGAEVYSNERKCWNCGAKTTNRKVRCIVLTILCIFFFVGYMCVSDYEGGYAKGLKEGIEQGKAEGLQKGIDDTTAKYEETLKDLYTRFDEKIKETKSTYYKKGKKDGVVNYKKKLKKRREEKRKKQEEEKKRKQEEAEQQQSEEQTSEEEEEGLTLTDLWHQVTGAYIPSEEEIVDVSAAQLSAIYETNQVNCKQNFDGRYLRITSTISDIGSTFLGGSYICLEDGDDNMFTDITCYMYKDQVNKVSSLTAGTQVTVVGLASIGSMQISLDGARITSF